MFHVCETEGCSCVTILIPIIKIIVTINNNLVYIDIKRHNYVNHKLIYLMCASSIWHLSFSLISI